MEAKDNLHPMAAGLQQGLDYSASLGIPFVFASNGDGFVFHDKTLKEGEGEIEKTLTLDEVPSPAQLWEKYRAFKGLGPEEERIVLQDYHDDPPDKQPRYYQQSAINATVEAIAKGLPPSLRGGHRKAADEATSEGGSRSSLPSSSPPTSPSRTTPRASSKPTSPPDTSKSTATSRSHSWLPPAQPA